MLTNLPGPGQQIIAAPASGIADELNSQINHVLGWPFRVASGTAFDSEGRTTAPFGALIFTQVRGEQISDRKPVNVAADTLACAIDVSQALDLDTLRRAYEHVVSVKKLRKSSAANGITHTTITFGMIFVVEAAVPLEVLADELHRLNQQTHNAHWPDMVVVASHGHRNRFGHDRIGCK